MPRDTSTDQRSFLMAASCRGEIRKCTTTLVLVNCLLKDIEVGRRFRSRRRSRISKERRNVRDNVPENAHSMTDEFLLVWGTSDTYCSYEQTRSEKGKGTPSKGLETVAAPEAPQRTSMSISIKSFCYGFLFGTAFCHH